MVVIYPRGGEPVTLRPCPRWCVRSQHFDDDDIIDVDDGFHHEGPEIAVPTSYRMFNNAPETVVKVTIRSWTHPLDAEPGPALIELQLATTEYNTDACAEITPGQARAVARALLQLADTAEHADEDERRPGV
jgi:hypothetical protein